VAISNRHGRIAASGITSLDERQLKPEQADTEEYGKELPVSEVLALKTGKEEICFPE